MTDELKQTEDTSTTEAVQDADLATETEKEVEKKAKTQSKYIRTAKGKKRSVKTVSRGKIYIQASLNNTIISAADQNGNIIAWATAGNCGFKGPKKSTPFAASIVVNKIIEKIEPFGMKDAHVIVSGIGSGRDSAIRTLNSKGLNVLSVKEVTPVAHNGCRPRRPRRV